MAEKRKLIIDTDPGVDDALAIIACLNAQDSVEILGLTTVAGNKSLRSTTRNAAKLLQFCKSDLKVYEGCNKPIDQEEEQLGDGATGDIHGAEGLGEAQLPYDESYLADTHAVDFILEMARAYPGEVDILALGPVTNLAEAIRKDKDAMRGIKSIHSMGGGIWRGNMTPVAEFNYWYDPKAVQVILDEITDVVPFYMYGLDLTHKLRVDFNDLFFFRKVGGETGQLINDLMSSYAEAYWNEQGIVGVVIHDLTAALGYLHPEVVTKVQHLHMDCVYDHGLAHGQCICDTLDNWHEPHNTYVVLDVNEPEYRNLMVRYLVGEEAVEQYNKFMGGK